MWEKWALAAEQAEIEAEREIMNREQKRAERQSKGKKF